MPNLTNISIVNHMKKQPSKQASEPADEDILPPQGDDVSGTAEATRAAGENLRMPPLIDHAEGWRQSMIAALRLRFSGVSGIVGAMQSGSLHLLRRTAYHLTLWMLVTATLLITGFGIWQARHIEMPQFDSFWFNSERVLKDRIDRINNDGVAIIDSQPRNEAAVDIESTIEAPNIETPNIETPNINREDAMPLAELKTRLIDAANNQPSDRAQVSEKSRQTADENTALIARLKASLAAEQAANQTELAESRARLAAAEAKIAKLSSRATNPDATNPDATNPDANVTLLTQRHAMADLLLRLQAGLAYDDILAAGDLQKVLTRRELALLALHGAVGIPTEPALALQFNGWVAMLRPQNRARPYQRVMQWLADNAAGLVRVSEVPLALSNNQSSGDIMSGDIMSNIAGALARGRLDAAAIDMGRLLRHLQGGTDISPRQLAALQAVYDDTRAAAELAPLLAKLKRDYISGARP